MAYLGRGLDKISNIEVLDNITFDGSSSYSITKGSVAFTPNSAQSLLISIDGVVQATNFTVSSSTIDFGVAIPSTSVCNFFLHYGTGVMTVPSDGSVTTAKLGDNAVTSAKMFSGFANGITMADQWRITTTTNSGTSSDVTSNWERVDTNGWSGIGTGLTESSGIFSFPSTGIYLIKGFFSISIVAGDQSCAVILKTTTDNSTYDNSFTGYTGNGSTNLANGLSAQEFLFDVTDITTHKFKFRTTSFSTNGTSISGNTDNQLSGFSVIRLGDT